MLRFPDHLSPGRQRHFDVQQNPDVLEARGSQIFQQIQQPGHRLLRFSSRAQRLQVAPFAIDNLFLLAKTSFEIRILYVWMSVMKVPRPSGLPYV